MNRNKRPGGKLGYVLCSALLGALTGCTTYVEQRSPRRVVYEEAPAPRVVYAPPPRVETAVSVSLPGVEIRTESDFYEPLTQYGRWEVVGTYGRCWIPGRVEADWRPYCNGHWQRTEAGWYWASEEPWGWATYHYGRWDFGPQFGWYWVPQTQWAPAWVSWHEGGGYVGWAPLHPSTRVSVGGSVAVNIAVIAPRAFVFVEPRHFLQPVRPSTVVVNNTTIINKTVNITNIKVVNNTVINEGPRTQIIEQASGQKVQALPVRELRRKQEAEVVARQQTTSPGREKKEKDVRTPILSEAAPRETKAQPELQQRVKDSEVKPQEQLQRSAKDKERATQEESQRRAIETGAKAQQESQRNARDLEKRAQQESERRAKDAAVKNLEDSQRNARGLEKKAQQESEQRAKDSAVKAREESQRNASGLDKKAQQVLKQPVKERPATSEQGETNSVRKTQAQAEKKTHGKPALSPKHEQVVSERGGTNTLKKAQQKRGKGKPSIPEDAPGTPPTSP